MNETLVRDLASGDFFYQQRKVVLIGGTGTGKSHLAVNIARSCIRGGKRGRFFNVVDLVNKPAAEARACGQAFIVDRVAAYGTRYRDTNRVVLGNLGWGDRVCAE